MVAGLVKSGGLKRSPPGPASIWPMFSPELKPVKNAVLEAVVAACALPAEPGASSKLETMNVFFSGELVSNEVATVPARAEKSYEHPDKTPGKYEIVLQSWKYVNYAKDAKGEFTVSKFVAISNVVKYTI